MDSPWIFKKLYACLIISIVRFKCNIKQLSLKLGVYEVYGFARHDSILCGIILWVNFLLCETLYLPGAPRWGKSASLKSHWRLGTTIYYNLPDSVVTDESIRQVSRTTKLHTTPYEMSLGPYHLKITIIIGVG